MPADSPLQPGLHFCPAHHDTHDPSLSIRHATDGTWLLHCFAGCDTEAILRAWGLPWSALFPEVSVPLPRRRTAVLPPRELDAESLAAWQAVLEREQRHARRREDAGFLVEGAAAVRQLHLQAERARAWADQLGDTEGAWAARAYAARVEGAAWSLEAALDGEGTDGA